jgi:formylmethanofuran dehydrogenase subunit C
VSQAVEVQLKARLRQRADFSEVLAGSWMALSAVELSRRLVYLEQEGAVPLGDLCDIQGQPTGRMRIDGELALADRLGAGMSEGEVLVAGDAGDEVGMAMMGGALVVHGNAGRRAGAASPGSKRGMSGGELVIRGSSGAEAGAAMRRGVLVIGRDAGERSGLGMIAGNLIIGGKAGADTGLWSKRGSVVALGAITPPASYAYACTYRPIHLRLLLSRLRQRYNLRIHRRHIAGLYRRYCGDFAELGKGEILEWVLQ